MGSYTKRLCRRRQIPVYCVLETVLKTAVTIKQQIFAYNMMKPRLKEFTFV